MGSGTFKTLPLLFAVLGIVSSFDARHGFTPSRVCLQILFEGHIAHLLYLNFCSTLLSINLTAANNALTI
jgi:hypothetical protein